MLLNNCKAFFDSAKGKIRKILLKYALWLKLAGLIFNFMGGVAVIVFFTEALRIYALTPNDSTLLNVAAGFIHVSNFARLVFEFLNMWQNTI